MVLEYADELQSGEEKTYRALVLSNLVAIHQKTGIGRLSAYCGAVSAGAAAGAGIAYLCGGGYEEVIHTVVNALAIVSGMVCDGAKASCAAKIASSVDAGILGYNMYLRGQQFYAGDGIVTKGVEATIQNIGRLGKDGMKETVCSYQAADITAKAALMQRHGISDSASTIQKRQKQKY